MINEAKNFGKEDTRARFLNVLFVPYINTDMLWFGIYVSNKSFYQFSLEKYVIFFWQFSFTIVSVDISRR